MKLASTFCHSASALCVYCLFNLLWVLFGVVCPISSIRCLRNIIRVRAARSTSSVSLSTNVTWLQVTHTACARSVWERSTHSQHSSNARASSWMSASWWAVMTSQSSGEPLIWLSAPPRRPPELLGCLWQLWLQQRNINGWPCLTLKRRTGSSFWMLRLRLLACSATPSMPSSTGTRRPINKRWLFSGSCLAALQLRRLLDGSSPSRVLVPRTGRRKNRASPLALPRVRTEDELQAKKPWRPWPWACEGSPLWGRATFIAVHGARSSSVPSGDRSANPATYSAPGRSDLQQAHILVSSAQKRNGTEMLATPSGVSRTASLAVSCRYATPGYRTSCSNNTRGQSRETGSLSRL